MRRKGLLDKGIPHGGMKSPGCLESREQGGDSGGRGGQGPGLLDIVLWLRCDGMSQAGEKGAARETRWGGSPL